jgi:hypothetical protein
LWHLVKDCNTTNPTPINSGLLPFPTPSEKKVARKLVRWTPGLPEMLRKNESNQFDTGQGDYEEDPQPPFLPGS